MLYNGCFIFKIQNGADHIERYWVCATNYDFHWHGIRVIGHVGHFLLASQGGFQYVGYVGHVHKYAEFLCAGSIFVCSPPPPLVAHSRAKMIIS